MLYFLTRCFLCLLASTLLSSEGAFGDTGLSFSPSSLVPAGRSSPSPGSRSNGKRITEMYRQLASHDKNFFLDVSVPWLFLWLTFTAVGPFCFLQQWVKRDQDSSGYLKFPLQYLSGWSQQKIIYSVDFPSNRNHNDKIFHFLISGTNRLNKTKKTKINTSARRNTILTEWKLPKTLIRWKC